MPSALPSANDLPALLAELPVWSTLDANVRAALAPQWQVRSMATGELLLPQGQMHSQLGMVVDGSIELHDPDLDHTVRLQRGQLFGFGATPARHLATWQATAATEGNVA